MKILKSVFHSYKPIRTKAGGISCLDMGKGWTLCANSLCLFFTVKGFMQLTVAPTTNIKLHNAEIYAKIMASFLFW